MSKACPLRQAGTADVGRPAPTPQVRSGITDSGEEPKKASYDEVLKNMKECLQDEASKQKFFDDMIDSGFV
jgi:hypothetical protein